MYIRQLSPYIILSCHGTESTGALKSSLRYSRCFLTAMLSQLGPLIMSISCIVAPSLQEPVIIAWLPSSTSNAAFWRAGNRSLIRLWRQTQASTMSRTNGVWLMLHGGQENLPALGEDAEGVLNYAMSSRQPVVEDPLLAGQFTQGVWFIRYVRSPNAS